MLAAGIDNGHNSGVLRARAEAGAFRKLNGGPPRIAG